MIVTLYTTIGCHLCEQAEAILAVLQSEGSIHHVLSVDIATDEELVLQYGIRIPVVKLADGQNSGDNELGWPFSEQDVRRFLEIPDHG